MYATIAQTVERGWAIELSQTTPAYADSLGRYSVSVRQYPRKREEGVSFTAYGDRLPDVIEQAAGAAANYDESGTPSPGSTIIAREGSEPVQLPRPEAAAEVREADADGSRDEPPTPLQAEEEGGRHA